jgi:hypothetical protein
VDDDLKLLEKYSIIKEVVGGSILSYEISSLRDGELARWSTASCALALEYRPFVSQQKKRGKKERKKNVVDSS